MTVWSCLSEMSFFQGSATGVSSADGGVPWRGYQRALTLALALALALARLARLVVAVGADASLATRMPGQTGATRGRRWGGVGQGMALDVPLGCACLLPTGRQGHSPADQELAC